MKNRIQKLLIAALLLTALNYLAACAQSSSSPSPTGSSGPLQGAFEDALIGTWQSQTYTVDSPQTGRWTSEDTETIYVIGRDKFAMYRGDSLVVEGTTKEQMNENITRYEIRGPDEVILYGEDRASGDSWSLSFKRKQ